MCDTLPHVHLCTPCPHHVQRAFGGFDTAAAAAAFRARTRPLLGTWCCAPTEGSGDTRASDELKVLDKRGFHLDFDPPLGVARPKALLQEATALTPRWSVSLLQNNVFGRAAQPPERSVELKHQLARAGGGAPRDRVLSADAPCCKYIGRVDSLQACIAAAEATPRLGATSVTWHRGAPGRGPAGTHHGEWEFTCYAVVDGTWQPVTVSPGQAEADSARAPVGSLHLSPVAEYATPWVDDMVVPVR